MRWSSGSATANLECVLPPKAGSQQIVHRALPSSPWLGPFLFCLMPLIKDDQLHGA